MEVIKYGLTYSKRQKLYETSLAGSDKKLNDVTELSGINIMVCCLIAALVDLKTRRQRNE